MSLELAAKHLASKGRGPDTMLIHMAPSEVAGLQALAKAHGGSLTVNPDTGLPEAGFLSKILPMAAGAALTYFSGGTINPMTAGLILGGGTAAATGSLNKGLMAGLGAYGGAGLAGGLLGAAPEAAADLASSGGLGALPAGAAQTGAVATPIATPMVQATNLGPLGTSGSAAMDTQLGNFGEQAFAPAAQAAPAASPITAAESVQAAAPQTVTQAPVYDPMDATRRADFLTGGEPPSRFDQLKEGFSNAAKDPLGFLKENKGYAMAAGLPLLLGESQQPGARPTERNPYNYTFSRGQVQPTPTPSRLGYENRYFTPQYMAGGGLAAMNPNSPMANIQQPGYAMATQSPMAQEVLGSTQDVRVDPYSGQEAFAGGGMLSNAGVGGMIAQLLNHSGGGGNGDQYSYNPETQEYTKMAAGGASHLGDYSDGGRLLQGPGDGVSDSIPATIGSKRPARLADGEFVVPARIVSEIGNGSTSAGARKLYKMMDRVQKARSKTVGKDKVATDTRAERLLPA